MSLFASNARQRKALRAAERRDSDAAWRARREAPWADPLAVAVWHALVRNSATFSSRSPIYSWQVERFYISVVEEIMAALARTGGPSTADEPSVPDQLEGPDA